MGEAGGVDTGTYWICTLPPSVLRTLHLSERNNLFTYYLCRQQQEARVWRRSLSDQMVSYVYSILVLVSKTNSP